ncbi:MAG: penicillin-binding protein 2 [Ruminococcaceae bacterium]|nr:penicillin-binding protein 2 [Oscillospiraceae bacterium]
MLKRALSLYMLISLCFMALLLKIMDINRENYSAVTLSQSTRTLTVGEKRGTVYDRSLIPLTNSEKKLIAAVTPTVQSAEYLKSYFTAEELTDKINDGYPFLCTVDEEIINEHIYTFTVPVRYSESILAPHIIGYLDSEGEGVSGIEKAYNRYLSENGGGLTVSFQVDAVGRVLAGMDKTVRDSNFSSKAGVVLTLDSTVQAIAEAALTESSIKSGAVIVMKAGTGELLAAASVPAFHPDRVGESLGAENSPLVNKAFSAYSVGSVFKSVVAAFALEEGFSAEECYECKGEITVGDTTFRCYNGKAHGETDMASALENSCNTYFINLSRRLNGKRLLSLCRRLGFGESDTFASSMVTSSGALPAAESLGIKGNFANFSFGQGDFSATPVQLASAYHALATGYAVSPVLVRGLTDAEGLLTLTESTVKEKVFSDSTVKQIRKMLAGVVSDGLADKAMSELLSLSGKTGTAQSGIYQQGKEICRTWFTGFFPSENPNYIVVVLNENGEGGNVDCAPVFKKICEGIVGG